MGLQTFDENRPWQGNKTIIDTTSGNRADFNPGNQGLFRYDQIIVVNGDEIDHVARLTLNGQSLETILGSVVIPAGQGLGGTKGVEMLAAVVDGTVVLGLGDDNNSIDVILEEAVHTGFFVYVTWLGGLL